MTIENFDKRTANRIGDDTMELLTQLALEHGITITRKSGSYGDSHYKMTIEFQTKGKTGLGRHGDDFKLYAASYQLNPEWLGKIVKMNNKVFTIIGLDTAKPKNCIMLEDTRKHGYKCSAQAIISHMGR